MLATDIIGIRACKLVEITCKKVNLMDLLLFHDENNILLNIQVTLEDLIFITILRKYDKF